MKCILCDRCKKIIEDPHQHRVLTCARPLLHRGDNDKKPYRGDDRQMNDIIWVKDLCTECAAEIEAATEPSEDGSGDTGA